MLHCNERAISFPGIKDKKAVTFQFGSIRNSSPEALIRAASELPSIEIGHFKYIQSELKVGELWGNQFIITLHEVEANEAELQHVIQQMRENGYVFVNGSDQICELLWITAIRKHNDTGGNHCSSWPIFTVWCLETGYKFVIKTWFCVYRLHFCSVLNRTPGPKKLWSCIDRLMIQKQRRVVCRFLPTI